ncbi:fibrous sheath CABYR-binding protein-like [Harpegnathos saltator]|uniref:fibrous sheath CABYR-binding protein-like n=1 Tax=Harpegnathos saltator TaxID=610380 RepID=UPI000DBEDE13|nr:fibrous sheath CABYR-binding protein-like [Harpegnathos saltator]
MERYPELRTVRREADILAEQIGAHVGVKPKEVALHEAEARLGEDEIKYVPEVPAELPEITPLGVITEITAVDVEGAKLEDKSPVPEEKGVKHESKVPSIPIPHPEEAPGEADLTREETSAEPSEIETQVWKTEADDETVKPVGEERLIAEQVKLEQEIISEHAEEIQVKTEPKEKEPSTPFSEEAPTEAYIKEETTVDVQPESTVTLTEPPTVEQIEAVDEAIQPVDEEQAEAEPLVEFAETEEAPAVMIKERLTDAEEAVPTVGVKEEAEELAADEPSAEGEEAEEPKVSEFAAVAEVEEAEAVKQPVLEVEDITRVEDRMIEEAPAEVAPSVVPYEVKEEEPPLAEREELPAEVAAELPAEAKREKVLLLEEKFHVFEAFEVEEKILIVKARPPEDTAVATTTIEPRPAPIQPYFVLDRRTKLDERELLRVIPDATVSPPITARSRSVTRSALTTTLVEESTEEIGLIAQSDVLETTELNTEARLPAAVGRAPPARLIGEYFQAAATESGGVGRPEITGRKMPQHKRLRDQSTVTSSSAGSQTDKTSRASHERVERERGRLTTEQLLRSIKTAAAGLTRGDTEREIRTINYAVRPETDGASCNCCLCGDDASSWTPTSGRPQADARTPPSPSLAAAFKRALLPVKASHMIPYDRLCPACRAKVQAKVTRDKGRMEEIVERASRDKQTDAAAPRRAASRKRTVEKRDQWCLAKIPRRKVAEVAESRRKSDPSEEQQRSKKTDATPLTPSCICFQLEKPGAMPARKGNCYCAD